MDVKNSDKKIVGYKRYTVPTHTRKCEAKGWCNLPGFFKWEEREDGSLRQQKYHKVLEHEVSEPIFE